jgi:hypothetical protein
MDFLVDVIAFAVVRNLRADDVERETLHNLPSLDVSGEPDDARCRSRAPLRLAQSTEVAGVARLAWRSATPVAMRP